MKQHKRRAYICGAMRGVPYFNFPLFDLVAKHYRNQGYFVYNPAEHDRGFLGLNEFNFPSGDFSDQNWTEEQVNWFMRQALAWDTHAVCRSDELFVLPNSEKSIGTHLELSIAKVVGADITYLTEEEIANW